MTNKTKKLLIGSGIAAAGVAALSTATYATAKHLMKIALDREIPKVKNMAKAKETLRGVLDDEIFYSKLESAGEKLENCGCDTVEISSFDKETLTGHWHHTENAERIIIAMHGWRSSWTRDFGIISDFWHENQCSVLYVEQRGQNNSGGDYMGFGLMERFDCLEWIKWVNKHNEARLPIYLAGVSMGASTVLMASGFDLPDNVHGIIADCGFTSPHAIWKHVAENNLHLSYDAIGTIASDICKKKIQMGAKDYSTVEALQRNQVPVLFVHGTDDRFVPVEMTYENYKACAAPKHLFVVPGAGHGMSYAIDQNGYQKILHDFWNTYD